ncbi:MAG: acetyl-CoA C-acyltransferase [Cyanobacteria bacterium HKST-UBA03]|nr:acetyl-CoA C-acyltransferase [Cyanobacteria bacterium HKST-UBA03]
MSRRCALETVVIVDACRTPIGRYGGALSAVRPDDLMALVIRALLERNAQVDAQRIEDVLVGAANQAGEDNRNVARMSALLAGLPVTVPGATVNRLCASGLMAVNQAAEALALGHGDIMIAGGVESMSRAPYVLSKAPSAFDRSQALFDTTIGWRFTNPKLAALYHPYAMGETAENVAKVHHVSRAAQDAFALASQQKYAQAHAKGVFADELVPVAVPQRKGDVVMVTADEHPRPDTTLEGLAKLKPAFDPQGSVTAGNSSGINDGASALLLMSESVAEALGVVPLARFRAVAVAGVDPATMGLGPIPASQKALARAGVGVKDLDVVELNEAFASQSIACIEGLGLDADKVNVNGGAIALGHPLGCSGARILTTLVHQLKRQGKSGLGLATMCVGVGQGVATVIEAI